MSYPEREGIREVRFVNMWCAPGFWGLVLLAVGIVGLLPEDLSRYVWPTVAIAAGAWLLFGPFAGYRERPRRQYEDAVERF